MASTGAGMNNLTTLIKRLEAATSRLEDIATTTINLDSGSRSVDPIQSTSLPASLPSASGLEAANTSIKAAAAPVEQDLPATVAEFDTIVKDDLAPFEKIAQGFGGIIAEQAACFCDTFRAQRKVILLASKAKEPSMEEPVYAEALSELQEGIGKVNDIREKNRKCPQENQLAFLGEGVGVVGWVTYKPKPQDYIGEILGGAQFYGNRILKEFKESDPTLVEWVRSFVKLVGALKSYVQENHPKGLAWNIHGVPAAQALRDMASASAAGNTPTSAATTGGAPPPPPPPPPPPVLDMPPPPPAPNGSQASDMSGVFADLNRGEAVTAGLKKVDKSQMTHKNPSLRAGAAAVLVSPSTRGKSPTPNRKPEALKTKKPCRCELDGTKWLVENYDSNDLPTGQPLEIKVEKNQSILISRCKSTTVRVVGKANAISIDNCTRLDLLIDSLVSTIDVTNTANFRLQILGTLPSISLDKVDGAVVYLSKESLGTEIYSSKCTSVNITLPPATDADDSVECPVPEQIKTWVENGQLRNEIVKQEG